MKLQVLITLFALSAAASDAFVAPYRSSHSHSSACLFSHASPQEDELDVSSEKQRRTTLAILGAGLMTIASNPLSALAEESMYAPTFVQEYSDFTKNEKEGWSYRDVKVGNGASPSMGDRVVFDWSGYTIGYFGRPFQAKGGPQGGAFDKDVDYYRTVLGSGQMVKGLECGMADMKVGSIRQIVVPFGELSYPPDDLKHERVGPQPTSFSGQRALNFVLENPRVDRTLLFNVKLIRIDKSNGKGGFAKG
jgi:FKBP-type peptidyl-prolyl cis-trans isomerase